MSLLRTARSTRPRRHPQRHPRRGAALCAVAALTLAGAAAAQSGPPPGGGGPGGAPAGPLEVGVVTLQPSSTPYTVVLPGRAVAVAQVDIRPRVEGEVQQIAYTPGRPVEAGALLFRIGDESYQAEQAAAEADLASAKASLAAAQSTLKRYRALEGAGVSAQDVETAAAEALQAEAAVASAEAALRIAKINLARTEIRSPIAGVADPADVSLGALVTANQDTALTTVTQLDPIYVDVQESSARIQRVRARLDDGTLKRADEISARATLESGMDYARDGTLVSPSVQVSQTTGSTTIRFRFPNPDRWIMPGQFLRVTLTLGAGEGLLTPQGATSRSADGALTAWTIKDGKAVKATLTTAGTSGANWIVTGGLEPGARVIVDNLRNMREGVAVSPVEVTIDADGLIEDAPGEADARTSDRTPAQTPSQAD